jgi:hypothetical protein
MQLIEVVLSLTSASMLLLGITSALAIANRTMTVATTRQASSTRTLAGLDRVRSDLAEAFPASNRTSNSVTLSVADRTGDGIRENIRYRWQGLGNPLQMSVNNEDWIALTDNLERFEYRWHVAPPQSSAEPASLDPPGAFVFESNTLQSTMLESGLVIPVPASYQLGDLLVTVVAINGQPATVTHTAGWLKIIEQPHPSVTLLVLYSVAPGDDVCTVSWSGNRSSYATQAHFRSPSGTASIASAVSSVGTHRLATAPLGTAAVNNSLVIRALAAKGPLVGEEATNMPGHLAVTLRRQLLTDPIVGLAYRSHAVGNVAEAPFDLLSSADFATATVVFQP